MSVSRNAGRPALLLTLIACCLFTFGPVRAADEKKTDAEKPGDAKKDAEAPADPFAVPEGDAAALLKFIEDLQKNRPPMPRRRPVTDEEKKAFQKFLLYRKKAPPAIKKAAEKIVEIEKDKSSKPYKKAKGILVEFRAMEIRGASADEQKNILKELTAHLAEKDLEPSDMGLAMNVGMTLERSGNTDLAVEAYSGFAKAFDGSDNEEVRQQGEMLQGCARRLGLMGKKMEVLTGTTMDGDKFDWSSYRGKVVLIDFWATWCGPCRYELPNVKKNYERYHEKGFDVVGISVDRDRKAIEGFLKKEELPWTTLHENKPGARHPMANYYGVVGIPTVILVDREGTVVSLRARGKELGRLLEEMLGPVEEEKKDEEKKS